MNSSPPYLAGLNQAQQEAVLNTTGPLLILAGAGAGKTRVITHRIVHLIHLGTAPHNILAVTFTNKAAREMRDRVEALINRYPPSQRAAVDTLPLVTTFHALGVRLLREFHTYLDLPRYFTIYDRADSLRATKQALLVAGYDPKEFEPKKILNRISHAKGEAKSQTELANQSASFLDQVAARVWTEYELILSKEKALDFDDLLLKTLHLLNRHEAVRRTLEARYTHIHIDEYQDTNEVQLAIATALAGATKNLCVVGDIDQNIYSWRGANIKNVLHFERSFHPARTIILEENYRSTQTIIAAANAVIARNKNRIPKVAFTGNETGDKISLYAAMTGTDEAEYVANTAASLTANGQKPGEIAVLYRTNFQSRVLEEAFLQAGIPYQLLGTKFYERKEVKDVLSYLRLALNPLSIADLVRVINQPARGIGKVTMLKVVEGKRQELTGATHEKVARFDQIITDIADMAKTKPLSETINFIILRTGLETELKKAGTDDDLSRLENLRELVTLAQRYDHLDPEEAVAQLLETAALESDQDELASKEEFDAVRLMTIHAAKGLEFTTVFITGLEEGLFPHERLDETAIDQEEERRLCYVALTRAAKKLYLSYAHLRTVYGSQRVNIPSSFLNEIPADYVENANPPGSDQDSGYTTTIFLD